MQQRLSLAVEAEVEEAKDSHFRQYKRRTVSQLRRSGAPVTPSGYLEDQSAWLVSCQPCSLARGVKDNLLLSHDSYAPSIARPHNPTTKLFMSKHAAYVSNALSSANHVSDSCRKVLLLPSSVSICEGTVSCS